MQIQTSLTNPNGLPVSHEGSNQGYFDDRALLDRVPNLLTVSGMIYAAILFVGAALLLQRRPANDGAKGGQEEDGGADFSRSHVRDVLARSEFRLLWLTRLGMVLLSQSVSGFYKAYGLEALGYDDEFLTYVGAIAAAFNCLGRLLFGFFVDRMSYKYESRVITL